jgi:molybdopterin-guanine dinucleotide biosynthesis protein A
MMGQSFDAIVLAGAASERFGGADKAMMKVGDKTLLERSIEAASDARRIIVAGPRRPLDSAVEWIQEFPPGAGPAHALAAALDVVDARLVAVLACDLPFVTKEIVARLVDAVGSSDGAQLRDATLNAQPLLAVYRTNALRVRLAGIDTRGASLREVVKEMKLEYVINERAATDCDTPDQLHRAQMLLDPSGDLER